MLKLGKKLDLLQVGQMASKTKDGSMDGMALVGGWALELYLVPKEGDHARKWIDEMKRDLKARGLVT